MQLDKAIGIHDDALLIRSRRATVLASNLANADTPNYKAKDIDFSQALNQAVSNTVKIQKTNSAHISGNNEMDASIKYRNPLQPSLDGNTVETQVEQTLFAKNATQYQASLQFLGGKFKSLSAAIRGE